MGGWRSDHKTGVHMHLLGNAEVAAVCEVKRLRNRVSDRPRTLAAGERLVLEGV